MNNDRLIRYNRDFLKWKQDKFISPIDQYKPFLHIQPSKGLINDPNCVFFKNGYYYILFQHHPNNPLHGLKTMSLAKTKDFVNFDYKYVINKLENDFESHGAYSGNAIVLNNKIIALYTGNKRDKNWNRTSSIIYSEFDLQKEEIINKRVILDNHQYPHYSEHFRDPYIFKYKNNIYFLLGSQRSKDLQGVILLFKFNKSITKANLIKEIKINKNYRMIECPNIAFVNRKVVLIYSPQYHENVINKDDNPDVVRYLILNPSILFNNDKKEINLSKQKEQILDYGLEYYAPQTFLKSKQWYVIGWVGIPTSNNYPESKYGWIFTLSMVKKIFIKNNQLILEELSQTKKNYLNIKNPKIFYQEINLLKNQNIIIEDKSKNKLIIKFKKQELIIERMNDKTFFPYNSKKSIKFEKDINLIKIEMFFDVSIIEIKINNKYWYTSRLYLEDSHIIRRNSE